MATKEIDTLMQTKDVDGNAVIHYPITYSRNVINKKRNMTLNDIIEELYSMLTAGDLVEVRSFIVTLPATNWSYFKPFGQTIEIPEMKVGISPVADIILSEDEVEAIKQLEAWSMIDRIVTSDGSVSAYCYFDKPEVDIKVQLKAVI